MKAFLFTALLSLALIPRVANAQAPCGAGIGIGPFGIGIVIDCPPPPPEGRVIIVRKRRPCGYGRVEKAKTPPRSAVPVVEAPHHLESKTALGAHSLFTVGAMFDSSSYSDGALAGGGVYARLQLTPALVMEGTISTLSSCTSCNPEFSRVDHRFSMSGLWYLGGIKPRGLNFYLKGGLLFNAIVYSYGANDMEEITQTAMELGGGVEIRLSEAFSLMAEATFMGTMGGDELGPGALTTQQAKGIPSADLDNTAVNFKAGLAVHF